jgi:biotin-dependent carboxylase-like uncharacterized protein
MSFNVIKPGFTVTIQDLGRLGQAHLGFARSGAVDQHASRWANRLLANKQTAAVLEIMFGQCELIATAATSIAITGADMGFSINGIDKQNWQTHWVNKGDRLSWSSASSGVYGYLAVNGGFQTELYFGSRSVTVREQIGKPLAAGQQLAFNPLKGKYTNRAVPTEYRPNYADELILRLLPSYQFEQFSQQQKQTFFEKNYQLSQHLSRVGYRFDGESLKDIPSQMTSEGMAYGSVEITSAGLPIILMNDAPTIGGYPKIGTVLSLDLFKLAQRHAKTEVRFELVTIEKAQHQLNEFIGFFQR